MTALLTTATMWATEASGNWSDYRDTSWGSDYGSATEFTINSVAQLAQFAYMVNNGSDFSGKTVTLSPNGEYTYYTMDVHYWTPIGTAEHPFRGTFNGNGMSVNYITINSSEATYQGLFGYIGEGGSVINTTVRYSTITAASQVGAIAGYNGGTMTNCVVYTATITGTSYTGAIVGQNADAGTMTNPGTMTNCYAITVNIPAIGGATTGTDDTGHAERLWTITGDNVVASVGTQTGPTVGDFVFYNDGIHFNSAHYYKNGATATLTYAVDRKDAIFNDVSGTEASISWNVVTVGTSDVTVGNPTKIIDEWTGTGESGNPYLISNDDQFLLLATRVNGGTSTYSDKYFKLTNDISTTTMVGIQDHCFSGFFDGDGHTLTVSLSSANDYCAPFAYTDGATIQNLITAGTINTSACYAGGVVGRNGSANLTMTNVKSSVVINSTFTGEAYHGGLVGSAINATIRGCAFTGQLLGSNSSKCGGLVGEKTNTENSSINFLNCLFAPTKVTVSTTDSKTFVVVDNGTANFTNCYYTQVLGTAQGKQVYSIVPVQEITMQLLNLETEYNVSGISTNSSSPKGLKFNDAFYAASGDQLDFEFGVVVSGYTASKYNAIYDDGTSHELANNVGFLGHYSLGMPAQNVTITATLVAAEWDGDGSEDHPYLIYNNEQLDFLATRVNGENSSTYNDKYYKLMADLAYNGNSDNKAIGYDIDHKFNGHFDGNGHTISGIKSISTGVYYNGLFGYLDSGAEVKNVILTSSTIGDGNRSGGIAGLNEGTITNCHVTSTVTINGTAQNSYLHGGIVGYNMGTVSNCTFAGTLTKTFEELSGTGFDAYCYGGIAGVNENNKAIMSDNVVIGATIPTTNGMYGAIVGQYGGTLARNYYTACTIGNTVNATGVGCSSYYGGDITANDGAVQALRNDADNSNAIALMATAAEKIGAFNVQLNGRTLYKDGAWNTLCLPFNATLTAGATIMELDTEGTYDSDKHTGFDASTGTLYLYFKSAETIVAGKPYIVKWESGNHLVSPTFTNVSVTSTTPTSVISSDSKVSFIGTYAPVNIYTAEKTNLYLGDDDSLYYPWGDGMTTYNVNAFRAYFQLNGITAGESTQSGNVKAFVLNFGNGSDVATGIKSMDNGQWTMDNGQWTMDNEAGAWYELSGRCLQSKPTKSGIYIHNGRKVVIK